MTKFHRLFILFILAVLTTGLCGCPPLKYKMLVRNMTVDTARLTLRYKQPYDTISKKGISVRATNSIVAIRKKSIPLLNENWATSADSGKITLVIPPTSTVYVSDIINSFYMFANKSLIIEHENKSDTMVANYPYKNIKGFKRKLDPSYNFFYRTIVYYDIR